MRLTILGASGSFCGPDSPASSYLVQAEDATGRTWSIVFDLGSGALGALLRHMDPWDLDAVVLTHLHPDHCIDCLGLYVRRAYDPQGPQAAGRLPLYGPAGTQDRLGLAYEGMAGGALAEHFDFRTVDDRSTWSIGPVTVHARRVEHPVEAYGYRIEADGAVLAYTGDTDVCPPLLELCRDADLMLTDSAFVEGRDTNRGVHLSGRRAAQIALDAGARRLMLTHLPAWNDPEVCRAQAAQVWPGEVELAAPSTTYVI